MPDMLNRIRSELDDRRAALKPLAGEYARLQRAADALDQIGEQAAAAGAAPPARAARASTTGRAATRGKPARRRRSSRAGGERAAPGQTQLRVIEQLRSAPGSSSTAVAQALGISANAAAATISRLAKQGRVSRLETGGYAPAERASGSVQAAALDPKPGPADS